METSRFVLLKKEGRVFPEDEAAYDGVIRKAYKSMLYLELSALFLTKVMLDCNLIRFQLRALPYLLIPGLVGSFNIYRHVMFLEQFISQMDLKYS
jgi:hypothetical protein